jgi:hypothetical protein
MEINFRDSVFGFSEGCSSLSKHCNIYISPQDVDLDREEAYINANVIFVTAPVGTTDIT